MVNLPEQEIDHFHIPSEENDIDMHLATMVENPHHNEIYTNSTFDVLSVDVPTECESAEAIGDENLPVFIVGELDDEQNYLCEATDELDDMTRTEFKEAVADSTLKYLRQLKYQAKRSYIKHHEYARMCILIFGEKFHDECFMSALANDLGFHTIEELKDFINMEKYEVLKCGRPFSDAGIRQLIYDYWLENSELSNDRRSGRQVMRAKKEQT